MLVFIIAVLALAALAAAMVWSAKDPGRSYRHQLARRPDWSDEQYRRAVEEYRKEQEAGARTRLQVGLWAVAAGFLVWTLVQL